MRRLTALVTGLRAALQALNQIGVKVIQVNATTFDATGATSLCFAPCEPLAERRDTPEVELVPLLRLGDEVAFCELVERYQSKIQSVTYGILRNRQDADEIAQEVFAKVYFSIKGFDARSSLYTWIYRIAVNECYGFLRKKRLKIVYEDDSADHTLSMRIQRIADGYPTPDRAALQRDFVNRLLERIPEDDRLLLIWKEVEGFSITEMSQMTGLKEATIKVRLFRARQKLVHAAAFLRPKCWTSGGMSSRRSRNGGISIGNTFRR
jgi:RNA polymerase sigma-70 factor (ECF subfamily)